jgi:hypothetical protein
MRAEARSRTAKNAVKEKSTRSPGDSSPATPAGAGTARVRSRLAEVGAERLVGNVEPAAQEWMPKVIRPANARWVRRPADT